MRLRDGPRKYSSLLTTKATCCFSSGDVTAGRSTSFWSQTPRQSVNFIHRRRCSARWTQCWQRCACAALTKNIPESPALQINSVLQLFYHLQPRIPEWNHQNTSATTLKHNPAVGEDTFPSGAYTQNYKIFQSAVNLLPAGCDPINDRNNPNSLYYMSFYDRTVWSDFDC